MSYRPPKKTGTALMPQKGEEIEKYNKHTKVKVFTKEEIAEYEDECECGAIHTSFPKAHYRWCCMWAIEGGQ